MLLIVSPLAYLGSAYYNGEDGIANIRDFFSGTEKTIQSATVEPYQTMTKAQLIERIEVLEEKVEQLERTINQLQSQN